jgi:hypothetical protein
MTTFKTSNKAFYPLVLLIIPVFASKVTKDFNWTTFDFLAMGLLLFAFGLIGDLVWQKANTFSKKLIYLGVTLLGFLAIWAFLAVGMD